MKKTLKLILAFACVVCIIAISAAAADFEAKYTMEKVDGFDDVYALVLNVKATDYITCFDNVITFDKNVIHPMDVYKTLDVVDLSTVTTEPFMPVEYGALAKYSFSIDVPLWKNVDSDKVWVKFGGYSVDYTKYTYSTGFDIMKMYFKLVGNHTIDDVTADVLNIEGARVLGNTFSSGAGTENYGYDIDVSEYQDLTITNNAVTTAPTKVEIDVTAGDVIIFADGTTATAETTGKYDVTGKIGKVVVNTGFTAQKVYDVTASAATLNTNFENGALNAENVSIRNDATASGIRFGANFSAMLRAQVKEYGYLLTTSYANSESAALNMALVDSGKAAKGVAYSTAGTDIFWDNDGTNYYVTMVASGIKVTEQNVNIAVMTRPYYILNDGTVVYGGTHESTLLEAAKAIYNAADKTVYNANKAYIDSILAFDPTAPVDEGLVALDLSPLFN